MFFEIGGNHKREVFSDYLSVPIEQYLRRSKAKDPLAFYPGKILSEPQKVFIKGIRSHMEQGLSDNVFSHENAFRPTEVPTRRVYEMEGSDEEVIKAVSEGVTILKEKLQFFPKPNDLSVINNGLISPTTDPSLLKKHISGMRNNDFYRYMTFADFYKKEMQDLAEAKQNPPKGTFFMEHRKRDSMDFSFFQDFFLKTLWQNHDPRIVKHAFETMLLFPTNLANYREVLVSNVSSNNTSQEVLDMVWTNFLKPYLKETRDVTLTSTLRQFYESTKNAKVKSEIDSELQHRQEN